MELRKLGNSDIEVSTITIGCWPFGGGKYWGDQSQDDVNKVVSASLGYGINFFDVAESYNDGASETSLGIALKDRRKDAVILSKMNPNKFQKGEGLQASFDQRLDAMLNRLQTDYLDILMIHWPNEDYELVEQTMRAFEKGVAAGKIRAIGISNFGPKQMSHIVDAGLTKHVCVNELQYNLVSRAIESEILPMCQENNFGVMTYCTLQQGVLTGKYANADQVPYNQAHSRHFQPFRGNGTSNHTEAGAEAEIFALLDNMRGMASDLGVSIAELSLAWALSRDGITSAIAGCRNLDQLAMNRRSADLKLSADVINQLTEWSIPTFEKLGTCADYFKNREDSRIK